MNNPIRLIVADIDGTLVGEDRQISPRVRQAINAARDLGVQVVLCTGRSMLTARQYIDMLALPGYHIVDSGATVVDPATGATLYQDIIPQQLSLRMVAAARQAELHLEAYAATMYFMEQEDQNSYLHGLVMQRHPPVIMALDEAVTRHNIAKLEIITSTDEERARLRMLEEHFADHFTFAWSAAPGIPADFVNIMTKGVSNGKAVTVLAEHLGIPISQVLGVGDGPNDEPLLATVGVPVAMGDAPDTLKRLAAWVTASVSEDGLAQAIDRYVLSNGVTHAV